MPDDLYCSILLDKLASQGQPENQEADVKYTCPDDEELRKQRCPLPGQLRTDDLCSPFLSPLDRWTLRHRKRTDYSRKEALWGSWRNHWQ